MRKTWTMLLVLVLAVLPALACSLPGVKPSDLVATAKAAVTRVVPGGTPEPTATPTRVAKATSTPAGTVIRPATGLLGKATGTPAATTKPLTAAPSPTKAGAPVPTAEPKPILGKAEIKDPDPKKLVQTKDWGEVPANQVAIVLKDGLTRKDAEKAASDLGGSIIGEVEFISLYQIETKGTTEAELKAALDKAAKSAGVEIVFPNSRGYPEGSACRACGPLSDPIYGEGENGRPYEMIGVKRAWDIMKVAGVKLSDVHVGVVDSALYTKSDEISGKVKATGLDPQDVTAQPETDNAGKIVDGGLNHGTSIGHIIGADPDNGGMVGVAGNLEEHLKITFKNRYDAEPKYKEGAPDPADPTKMVWTDGKAYAVKDFQHIIKQIETGATVINMSFWTGANALGPNNAPYAAAWTKFLDQMHKKHPKVLFVASAGNSTGDVDGTNHVPGGIKAPNLISVGALDNQGKRASFSNRATGNGEVTISAPADDLPVGVGPDGKTVTGGGTSYAAPQVVAAAALIRSINPKLSAEEIKKLLVDTAAPGVPGEKESVPIPQGMGKGVLRVDEAVLKAINDLRKAEGKPALDGKLLDKLAVIEGSSTLKEPKEYKVEAKLDAVLEGGADVSIELRGQGAIGGSSKKRLTAPGSVSWDVTAADEKSAPTVRLCRLDVNACCDIVLETIDLAGIWRGTVTLTSFSMKQDITIPDPLPQEGKEPQPIVIKKEDCEKQFEQQKGKAQPYALEFQVQSPTSGLVTFITIDEETGKEEKQEQAMPYRLVGDQVIVEMAEEGAKLRLEGRVSSSEKEFVLKGTWAMTMAMDGAELLKLTADFSVSKPKP